MLLSVNLVLMVTSPDTQLHLPVIDAQLVPMLTRLLATHVPLELSLLVEPTTVLPVPQAKLPDPLVLLTVTNVLLAIMNKTEPLVTTALLVPSPMLMVLLIFLNVRLVQLERSPETPDQLLAPSALLVAMPSTELAAITAPLVLFLLKELEISMIVSLALPEASPRILDQPLALNALLATLSPTEPSAMPALLVLLLLKDLSSPLTVLLAKKDGSLDMQELLNAQSALMVPTKSTEPPAFLVTLDQLLSSTIREKRNAEPALKDLSLLIPQLLTVPSVQWEPSKSIDNPVILAPEVLTLIMKLPLNASHALLELMVTLKELSVPVHAKLALLATLLPSQDKLPARDAPQELMKETETAVWTALQEVSLLLAPLNVPSAPLVQLLTMTVPLSARSVP